MSNKLIQYNIDRSQHDQEENLFGKNSEENLSYLMETIKSLRSELRSSKVDNANMVIAQEMKEQVNAVILQILSNLQKHKQCVLGSNYMGR